MLPVGSELRKPARKGEALSPGLKGVENREGSRNFWKFLEQGTVANLEGSQQELWLLLGEPMGIEAAVSSRPLLSVVS